MRANPQPALLVFANGLNGPASNLIHSFEVLRLASHPIQAAAVGADPERCFSIHEQGKYRVIREIFVRCHLTIMTNPKQARAYGAHQESSVAILPRSADGASFTPRIFSKIFFEPVGDPSLYLRIGESPITILSAWHENVQWPTRHSDTKA